MHVQQSEEELESKTVQMVVRKSQTEEEIASMLSQTKEELTSKVVQESLYQLSKYKEVIAKLQADKKLPVVRAITLVHWKMVMGKGS